MKTDTIYSRLDSLANNLEGDLKYDKITRTIYATDASVYKEFPVAVIWPKGKSDLKKIIAFAAEEKTAITMRAAGTSLAGQVVSSGIIVDISKYMKKILEINTDELWARVEPGVVLDELNLRLKEYDLFFAPETSTSNRCNLGGMVGNNACGSHSVIYGSTRDHLIELKVLLSDGSEAIFGPVDKLSFDKKCLLPGLEGNIYRKTLELLSDPVNCKEIRENFPDPKIPRRNTGYALDLLFNNEVFDEKSDRYFNFCNILSGSEGTLAVTTEIKLNLVKLPPSDKAIVCVHLDKRNDAFLANLIALKYKPSAVEMMDDKILQLTEGNISQRRNRFFLEGKPAAIVIVEFAREKSGETEKVIEEMTLELRSAGYGYAFPVVKGKDIAKVWDLRKAGLGVLANMKGDPKPVSLIEDTVVNVENLPEYIADFEKMLSAYGKDVVYHAHIGTGELHIRPVLNLKDEADVQLFRTLGIETAKLVRKYRGSMSGEHGDGRLRGEFIPIIIGEHNYNLLREVKKIWDPQNIMNPGKITDTPQMNTSLRYIPGIRTPEIGTIFDFSSSDGIIRAAEKCNGSGDCRKTQVLGGTMCPTFMATGEEKDSTRARANIIREFLSADENNPWDHKEIYDILDLCIACKGCKSECPSGVDIAKLKAEFLQHWYDKHGIPLRTILIAYISTVNRIGSLAPGIFNFFLKDKYLSIVIKKTIGFASRRSIPLLHRFTLKEWIRRHPESVNTESEKKPVCLLIDEFTDYNDTPTGIKAIKLLAALGYKVITVKNSLSARTFLSKGLIRKAKKIIRRNINLFSELINEEFPLLGIEPSAILGFRDEYPELAGDDLKEAALRIAENSFLIDEFISNEFKAGRINRESFIDTPAEILLHAHCQQKAIASSTPSIEMLSIPVNYKVREIPSGCCGMAGSFGYEKEHFDLSNRIGELVLFPEVREADESVIIAAPGTSCRNHIKDGTGRTAIHPVEILYDALKKK
ncbi:MAG: FAD-binding protein [Bacteroidales bacterium]|jgi:FAD/FMN-containing dehydrogenase/Fe-S oxidoreductase|nr:FAD-binding protein [Bacteroidales bacterium]